MEPVSILNQRGGGLRNKKEQTNTFHQWQSQDLQKVSMIDLKELLEHLNQRTKPSWPCCNFVARGILCSSSSIIKLNCDYCRILEDCVLNWTSLKSLTLESLFLRDEHIKQIMSNSDTCCSEIVAPYVEHLIIFRDFSHTKIKLGDFSFLNHTNLDLYCDEYEKMDENILKCLLVSVRCENELILSSWLMKSVTDPKYLQSFYVDCDFNFDVVRGRHLLTVDVM
ncbi:hypothetical protein H5410_005278 [Solanum commersonii]|uniref:Uncharacterized protein n=1 Tax=Solanum commersonii TaxID=4109 RepID=A0A9J6A750_SOLCO|nr:hypothetical protein H5410_005278 [Solanum commersonii]